MPVLFVGHGSPTNAIEDNEFSRVWTDLGNMLPRPDAIVSISAHWETSGTRLTSNPQPKTLYDFHGFPQTLYQIKYAAPGAPELAKHIKQSIADHIIQLDESWGLDHGTWSVLCHMFPNADIPVIQLSLDIDKPPELHYQLGRSLKFLRDEKVLVMGSGNMVHNLRAMVWKDIALDWAQNFDDILSAYILAGKHQPLINYRTLDDNAAKAIPTNEHFLPLLYILAMQDTSDVLTFFNERVTLGAISMRSLILGSQSWR